MKLSQIMIYGGKHNWIDLSHRKYPDVSWFIFIGVEPTGDLPEHWEKIEDKIKQLEDLQKDFPISEQIKYTYIKRDSGNDLVDLIRFFRALINDIHKKGYQITCNLTAGIFELRMALFLASQIESDKVFEIFYLNKQTSEKNLLFKSIKISKRGKLLLEIIYSDGIEKKKESKDLIFQNMEFSLTELRKLCVQHELNMDLPTVSRLTSKLIKEGYLKERREGRKKKVSLTDIGLIFCPISENLKIS